MDNSQNVTYERMNSKVPAEIKMYLYAQSYRVSSPTKKVSMTEYLCEIVRQDMEKNKKWFNEE